MADRLEVLLVEDEKSKIEEWSAAVAAFNADVEKNGFVINTWTAASIAAAMETIARAKLDALVVDLRLEKEPGVGEDNDDGNELIRRVVETTACGVVVYTGQRGQANLKDYPQVEVFDKGDGAGPVFDWLSRQRALLTQLRAVSQAVERETAKVFFKSIWPRWKQWSEQGTGVSEALARHVTAHVHDALLDAAKGEAHPEEAYFVPPLKERLDTGDLVKLENDIWVVVTPRCDLANKGKVASLLLAKCLNVAEKYAELEAAVTKATSNSAKKDATDKLTRYLQHEGSPKQHFLPPALDIDSRQMGPWMVQFHDLQVLPVKQGMADLPKARIASLAPQFVPSLVERFGSYFSRIGTPNMSSD